MRVFIAVFEVEKGSWKSVCVHGGEEGEWSYGDTKYESLAKLKSKIKNCTSYPYTENQFIVLD